MLRLIGALAVATSALALAAMPALASCLGPLSVAEYAKMADAVVYGRVQGFEGPPGGPASRFASVRVERVLKGSAVETIGVATGPGAEGGGGSGPVATSIDYQMERGTDHVLYLRQHSPAGYSTDACAGSHPGAPTPAEEAFFGPGKAPDRSPGGVGSASDLDRGIAALAAVAAVAAAVGAVIYARARRRPTADG